MGIIRPPNRMQESNEDHGVDLEAIRRMVEGEPAVKALVPSATGKLRIAPTKVEQAMEEAQDRISREMAGLAKQIAKTEDYYLKKAIRRCVPSSVWRKCQEDLDRGNSFPMRKMMNEFEIKLHVVQHPDLEESDEANGITRRHLRVTKSGAVVWEHVWEWSRG
jgi:DNA-binding transcriptional MerR regulator